VRCSGPLSTAVSIDANDAAAVAAFWAKLTGTSVNDGVDEGRLQEPEGTEFDVPLA
jgi:hypothetical protein